MATRHLVGGSSDQQPVFENLEHANRVLGLVMEYYNGVARTLMDRPERYSPLFSVDSRNVDILWELWIEDFEKAVAPRPAAWNKLLDADVDTAAAMSGMLLLVDIARGETQIDGHDPILAAAPDKIADWVATLNEWRLANIQPEREDPRVVTAPRKKLAATIPAHAAQARNIRNAAVSIDRDRGPCRMLTFPSHPPTENRRVRDPAQAFLGDVVDDVEDAEAPSVGGLVLDEVQRPACVRLRFRQDLGAGCLWPFGGARRLRTASLFSR